MESRINFNAVRENRNSRANFAGRIALRIGVYGITLIFNCNFDCVELKKPVCSAVGLAFKSR